MSETQGKRYFYITLRLDAPLGEERYQQFAVGLDTPVTNVSMTTLLEQLRQETGCRQTPIIVACTELDDFEAKTENDES